MVISEKNREKPEIAEPIHPIQCMPHDCGLHGPMATNLILPQGYSQFATGKGALAATK